MKSSKIASIKSVTAAALAMTAAGFFTAGAGSWAHAAEEGKVHCVGVNGCKGKSECATAANACKGQNGCKGQGFVSLTEKECKDKKGMVEKKS
jgi:hypothetical protein